MLKEVQASARAQSLQLVLFEARTTNEFDQAFVAMAKQAPGALLVLADPMITRHRARITDLATRHRLPSMYGNRLLPEAGGLISYGPDFRELFRRAAIHVDKILQGAKPADLPVDRATKFELVINLKTARALGVTMPSALLARADQVIQ